MKSSVQLALVALGGLVLIIGAYLGLRPITTHITVVSPRIIEVAAPCGIGYIPGIPGTVDPVPLRSASGVLVPRSAYERHCELVISWQPYVAWGLTAAGLLGLALLFANRRNRVGVWPGA